MLNEHKNHLVLIFHHVNHSRSFCRVPTPRSQANCRLGRDTPNLHCPASKILSVASLFVNMIDRLRKPHEPCSRLYQAFWSWIRDLEDRLNFFACAILLVVVYARTTGWLWSLSLTTVHETTLSSGSVGLVLLNRLSADQPSMAVGCCVQRISSETSLLRT